MKKWIKKSIITLGALALVAPNALLAQAQDGEFEGEEVTVAVVGESSERTWNYVAEKALEEEGITINIELLTDYVVPNVALADGSVDLNAFQHVAFLDNWNAENDGDLEPIGFTLVTKLGLYSDKYESVEDIPENATIAIPSDPTNGGRALLGLEIAGLIEVDDEAGILPTVDDITDNPLNITIDELEAGQLPLVLPDVDAAFINSGHASNAGLSPSDAIFVDTDNPEALNDAYRNIIAARGEDVDNELYLKIVEIYQQDDVAEVIFEEDNGGSVPAWEGAPTFE
ncbi:MetQ/NlpA family ABC transporter substrate-binding protein [Aerococcaceae bacterium DSM 111176]|nr:MetQ/NlpA family ABC transporter substrate-binding protein [Aerococcaceae bacterium DSM 111176]